MLYTVMEQESLQSCIERQKAEFENLFPQLKSCKSEGPRLSLEKIGHNVTATTPYSRTTRRVVEFSKVSSFENRKLQSITSKATTIFRSFDGAHLVKLEQISTFNLNDDEYQDFGEPVQTNSPLQPILEKLDYAADHERADQLTESNIAVPTLGAVLLRLDSIRIGTVEEIRSKTKLDKAWLSAKELVETEKKYVGKLHLIHEIFRNRIRDTVTASEMNKMLSNVESLHSFHKDYLLPSLQQNLDSWQSDHVIADVMLKYSPYLKMYSIYVNNFTPAMILYEELKIRNKLFASAVLEIQEMPECENLPFDAHMICPVQRVPRYQLLLQQYLDNLPGDHIDRHNTEIALEKVKESAKHANEFMKKLEKYKHVVEIQEQIGHQVQGLVTPSRQFIKKGYLQKISRVNGECSERLLFLFNDLIMLCTESRILKKLKLKALLSLETVRLVPGDNLIQENTFYIMTPDKVFEMKAPDSLENLAWTEAFAQAFSALFDVETSRDKVILKNGTADHPPKIILEGFVDVRANFRSSQWLKRYLVLTDNGCLKSFSEKVDVCDGVADVSNTLFLASCKLEPNIGATAHAKSGENVFTLHHPNQTYFLRCETKDDMVSGITIVT